MIVSDFFCSQELSLMLKLVPPVAVAELFLEARWRAAKWLVLHDVFMSGGGSLGGSASERSGLITPLTF